MESKVILITGAGSGVGRATALKFLRLGWRVVLAGRRIDALLETVALSGCTAEMAFVFSVDVTVPEQMTALFDAAVERFGRIDVVFN
ncbi:MAG: SDR family oxidoreductase, partial [Armatimonadota bacterium]